MQNEACRTTTDSTAGRRPGDVIDRQEVAMLAEEVICPAHKGWPPGLWGRRVAEVAAAGQPLSRFPTPLVTLSQPALAHNIDVLAGWARRHGFELAPHGKTSMAPQLWQRQLDAGAWGITLANLSQLAVARHFGVQRVLIANMVLSAPGLHWIAAELDAHPDVTIATWVDSAAAVEIMTAALSATTDSPTTNATTTSADPTSPRPVDVMVELGGAGGRTGARCVEDALAVAEAVAASPRLRLVGAAGYEGALAHGSFATGAGTIRSYLGELARLHDLLLQRGLYATESPIVSAGGSAYPDVVAEVLQSLTDRATVLIRSGAYITHDDGYYRHISPWGEEPRTDGEPLHPAIHGWIRISSVPEPGMAVFDAGKRDLPYDEGMPEVQLLRPRTPGAAAEVIAGIEVTAVNDQHGFLRYDPASTPVKVGDELRLGLSHPCTTFDKWTLLPVVDDPDSADPVVVDAVRTFF